MDIKHHSDYHLYFDEAMYEHLVSLKTGTLFSLSANLALLFSNKKDSLLPRIFNEVGIVFQMLDDLKNIEKTGIKGKFRGDDIVEGKLSFPIVLFLEKYPDEKERIIEFFAEAKKDGISSKAVEECCSLLRDSGTVEKGFKIANDKLDFVINKLNQVYGYSSDMKIITNIFKGLCL